MAAHWKILGLAHPPPLPVYLLHYRPMAMLNTKVVSDVLDHGFWRDCTECKCAYIAGEQVLLEVLEKQGIWNAKMHAQWLQASYQISLCTNSCSLGIHNLMLRQSSDNGHTLVKEVQDASQQLICSCQAITTMSSGVL